MIYALLQRQLGGGFLFGKGIPTVSVLLQKSSCYKDFFPKSMMPGSVGRRAQGSRRPPDPGKELEKRFPSVQRASGSQGGPLDPSRPSSLSMAPL